VRPRAAGTAPGSPAWSGTVPRAAEGRRDPPCPGHAGGHRWPGVPAATPGYGHGMRPAPRVDRFVDRVTGKPSATGAASAILRVTGAASALSARRRGYGKEKVYGSIPYGAPGHDLFSNNSDDRRGTSRKRRSSALIAPIAPRRALWESRRVAAEGHSAGLPLGGPAGPDRLRLACRLRFRRLGEAGVAAAAGWPARAVRRR
jgi:hypothetical protein